MFLYRPVTANRQLRLLVAAVVAIMLHIVLMGLHAERKPASAPQISVPRSVNVFLGQSAAEQTLAHAGAAGKKTEKMAEKLPVKEVKNVENATPNEIVVEMIAPTVQSSVQQDKSSNPINESIIKQKQPAIEKIKQVRQQIDSEPELLKSTDEKTGGSQQPHDGAEYAGALPKAGAPSPGAMRTAYPRYQLNSPPAYPGLARKRGQQGKVILQVLVNKQGLVNDLKIEVSSGYSMLDRAAEKAVKKWHFEPGRNGADTVSMWVRVPVTFKLK